MPLPLSRPDRPVLTFLGAAGTVTGSRFLIDTPDARVLVDCGLYQGPKELRRRNWDPLPLPPDSLDAVVLSHAHVDHCGYLPVLVRDGFAGPVHTTPDTAALAAIVLPDSGHLHEEEAGFAARAGYSRHHPPLPLYTEQDGLRAAEALTHLPFGTSRTVADGVTVTLHPAGHILGSAIVTIDLDWNGTRRRVVFSGDLGRAHHPLLRPPTPLPEADVVLCESTYGDRIHAADDGPDRLAEVISRTAERGGVVVIPAFAVDRTEVVLIHLRRLVAGGRIPDLPVYADSPMALAALAVYRRALRDGAPDVQAGLPADPFGEDAVIPVRDVDGSKELDRLRDPAVIISASGMATGGRVLHHLARYLPDPASTVILVGYQAEQTRGRRLAQGEAQVKMLGRYVPVRAEIVDLPAFSVHADRDELLTWLASAPTAPEQVYVVHGEPEPARSLATAAHERLGVPVVVPRHQERVRLD